MRDPLNVYNSFFIPSVEEVTARIEAARKRHVNASKRCACAVQAPFSAPGFRR